MSSINAIQNKFNKCSVFDIKTCIKKNSESVNWQDKGNLLIVSVDVFVEKCKINDKNCDEIIFHEVEKGTKTRLHVFLIEEKGHSREVGEAIPQLQESAKIMGRYIKEGDYHAFQPIISCKKMSSLRRQRQSIKIRMHNKKPKLARVVLKTEKFYDEL